MKDLRWREAVEERTAGGGVGAHVLGVDQFAQFQVGQLFGQTDGVEGVARGTEDRAKLRGTFFEALQMILAMVKNDSAIGVRDTVIEVVAELAAADRLTDDLGNSGGG
jgi:hypothetical protein